VAKAYWVTFYRAIKDTDAMTKYAALAGPALQAHGGRFIVRGVPAQVYEGGRRERVVVIEFDSVEQATKAHDSAEYAAALRALGDGADREIRICEGIG